MKIITWNVNGIRAIERKKALQALVDDQSPDVLMLQETKSVPAQLSGYLVDNPDYQQHYSSADKKGYAGTGIWIRRELAGQAAKLNFSNEIPDAPNADEGRLSQLSFKLGKDQWELLSIYFPNGGKSEQAWAEKLVFYDRLHDYITALRRKRRIVVVGGDMNVAHHEIDLARPRANDGKIGFHPKERQWMDRLEQDNWSDVWRSRNEGVTDVYSWWHMISKGRERNVGWRIDYFLMAKKHLERVGDCGYLHDHMGSDHCPMWIEVS